MPKFWQFVAPSIPVSKRCHDLEDETPPRLIGVWDEEKFAARVAYGLEKKATHQFRYVGSYPNEIVDGFSLEIADERFAPDALIYGLVSEHLREVMALPNGAVQYAPINDSKCHPAARAKCYERMIVTAACEAIDFEASGATYREMNLPGQPGAKVVKSFRDLTMIDGLDPPAPVFTDPRIGDHWYCTDEFAERVLDAGITDVAFMDPGGTADAPITYKQPARKPFAGFSEGPRR